MPIHLDVETYSECDLKKHGSYIYARHPSTDVMCVCWDLDIPSRVNKKHRFEWTPGGCAPRLLFDAVDAGHRIWAHNCAFDAEIWRCVLTPRYGWPWPGYDAFVDTMGMGQLAGLPGKLELAAKFFGGHQKSSTGHALMLKLSKPAQVTPNLTDKKRHHTASNIRKLVQYCHDDVAAEKGFATLLPRFSKREEAIWRSTWNMNRRGVQVDVPLVKACRRMAEQLQAAKRDELSKLTGGEVTSEYHRPQLGAFLEAHGAVMPRTDKGNISFNKNTRDEVILDDADDDALEALGLYDELNKSSISKFNKMLACLGEDGRIRGMLAYCGAAQTGRWAGREVQLQNLPRGILAEPRDYEIAREMILGGCELEDLYVLFGDPLSVISSMIRPCLVAAPGHKLLVRDYAAIEGRTLAWSVGEEHILDAYRHGRRLYAVAAAAIFNCTYEQVLWEKKHGDSSKDRIGKTADLSANYGGSVGAFKQMGGKSLGLEDERIKEIIGAWREDHPRTVAHWRAMERCAIEAIEHPGRVVECGIFAYQCRRGDLRLRLPSGRLLWFHRARVGTKHWPDGGTTPQIEYFGLDQNNNPGWQNVYGGKLTGIANQALARDIIAPAIVRADRAGLAPIITVHDEIVCEVPEDQADGCATRLDEIMLRAPKWGAGIPLGVAGFIGDYYRKD